jgi:hypothetical protein
MSIDIEDLDDSHEGRNDYRRANGAPLVSDPANPDKTLRYRRPSSYGKNLDGDAEALINWRIDKAMHGVARSRALAAKVSACRDDDRVEKKALREEALDKGSANEAADMGTALHAMTVRSEDFTDTDWDPPEQYVDDLNAYTSTIARYGLVSEFKEVHMVNDSFRAAGTADRIYRSLKPLTDPDGKVWPVDTLWLADIKTGKKMDFALPSYCVQMAIYADGQFYDVATERRMPTPEINPEWTILVHLPVGRATCTLLWLSVSLGLKGALLSFDVKEWGNAWKAGRDGHDSTPVAEPGDDSLDRAVAGEPALDSSVVAFIRERISTVATNERAKGALQRRWPAGVPTPKQGLSKPLHLVQVLNLLDELEKEYELPFTPDPRVHGMHMSELPLSNDQRVLLG